MLRLLRYLFLDSRARAALKAKPSQPRAKRRAASPAPQERSAAEAIAEAEERMRKMPPEKAQLIRTARLIHRAQQSTLSEIDDEQREKLASIARRALLGAKE